jgi:hypothetical protein
MYEDAGASASILHEGTRRSVDLPAVLMSYHVHPGPAAMYGLQNTSTFITHPSMEDIIAYIRNFPTNQVNFILDINGIFIVDVIRTLVDIKTGALSKNGILRQIQSDTGENLMNTNNTNALDLYLDYVKTVYNDVLLLQGPHTVLNGTYYYVGADISSKFAQFVAKTGIQIIYIPYSTMDTPTFQINTVAPLPIKKLQRYIRTNAL